MFHWEYWWWNVPFVPVIGAACAWVGALAALDAALIPAFGPILSWI